MNNFNLKRAVELQMKYTLMEVKKENLTFMMEVVESELIKDKKNKNIRKKYEDLFEDYMMLTNEEIKIKDELKSILSYKI